MMQGYIMTEKLTIHAAVQHSEHSACASIVMGGAAMSWGYDFKGDWRARGVPLAGAQSNAQLCRRFRNPCRKALHLLLQHRNEDLGLGLQEFSLPRRELVLVCMRYHSN